MERANLLFGCYRRGDANNPDVYVAAVTAVLVMYDDDLIREVTDPRTGIQTMGDFTRFPPNAGELKSYCAAHAAYKARLAGYADLPPVDRNRPLLPAPPPRPGRRANIIVGRDSSRYREMCDRANRPGADPAEFEYLPNGIKVAMSWWWSDRQRCGQWRSPDVLTATPQLAAMLDPHRSEAE